MAIGVITVFCALGLSFPMFGLFLFSLVALFGITYWLASLNLKKVIEDFPKTSSFSGAKIGLKDAFVSKGSVNEYLSYINKIPQLDISISAKDSLTYLL